MHPHPYTHLCHLLLALSLGGFRVSIVISFYNYQIATFGVDDKLAWGVLKREGHLIKHCTQLLQRQNSAQRKMKQKFNKKH